MDWISAIINAASNAATTRREKSLARQKRRLSASQFTREKSQLQRLHKFELETLAMQGYREQLTAESDYAGIAKVTSTAQTGNLLMLGLIVGGVVLVANIMK